MFSTLEIPKKSILIFSIGLIISLLLVFSVVLLSGDESQNYAELYKKLCYQSDLDPQEFQSLQEILVKTENVEITNIQDLKEYLCGNCKECVFPKDDKLIEKVFGLSKKAFHITLKPDILKKLKASSERIQKFLRKTKRTVLKSLVCADFFFKIIIVEHRFGFYYSKYLSN